MNLIRNKLSKLVSSIQINWMKQYGSFNSNGRYVFEKTAPGWVYAGQRYLGKLAIFLDPR